MKQIHFFGLMLVLLLGCGWQHAHACFVKTNPKHAVASASQGSEAQVFYASADAGKTPKVKAQNHFAFISVVLGVLGLIFLASNLLLLSLIFGIAALVIGILGIKRVQQLGAMGNIGSFLGFISGLISTFIFFFTRI
jgi:hypothetical protein